MTLLLLFRPRRARTTVSLTADTTIVPSRTLNASTSLTFTIDVTQSQTAGIGISTTVTFTIDTTITYTITYIISGITTLGIDLTITPTGNIITNKSITLEIVVELMGTGYVIYVGESITLTCVTGISITGGFAYSSTTTLTIDTTISIVPNLFLIGSINLGVVIGSTFTVGLLILEDVNHTLNLAQVLNQYRVLVTGTNSTIHLDQSLTTRSTISVSLHHVLTFPQIHYTNTIFGPIGHNVVGTNLDMPVTILRSDDSVIILPNPGFGDAQVPQHELILKKSINNLLYSSVRQGTSEKLKYNFFLGKQKAYELQTFVLGNLARPFILENFKGETWRVYLSNNPFEFMTDSRWLNERERVQINMEFEGIKIS